VNQLNLKDIQAILEGLSVYYSNKNYDPAFSQRLVEQVKALLGNEREHVQAQMLHSFFKSFRGIRYHEPDEIFTILTQKVIERIRGGEID
jgi:transposase